MCEPRTSMFSACSRTTSMHVCHARHAVGAGVDRRRRHEQRRPVLLAHVRERQVTVVEVLHQRHARCGPAAVALDHPVRAAERDHLAHRRRVLAGEQPGVDAAEALADQRHGAPVLGVQLDEAALHAVDDARRRADVASEPPRVGPVALAAQRPAQRRQRRVVGAEAGQQQHRVLVAAAEPAQQRPQRPEPRGLRRQPCHLERLQAAARRADGSSVAHVHRRTRRGELEPIRSAARTVSADMVALRPPSTTHRGRRGPSSMSLAAGVLHRHRHRARRGLLTAVQRGRDRGAWRPLVMVEPYIRRRARRVARDEHLVDDIVQEVWILLARRASCIRDPKALIAWLGVVTLRRAIRCATERPAGGHATRRRRGGDRLHRGRRGRPLLGGDDQGSGSAHALGVLDASQRTLIERLTLPSDRPRATPTSAVTSAGPVGSLGPSRQRAARTSSRRDPPIGHSPEGG